MAVFDRAEIAVSDVPQATAFLADVLGFAGTDHPAAGPVAVVPAGSAPVGIRRLVWTVEDLAAARGVLDESGAVITESPAGVCRTDPASTFGVPIELRVSADRVIAPNQRARLHHIAVAAVDGPATFGFFQRVLGGRQYGPNQFGDFQALTIDAPVPYLGVIFPIPDRPSFVRRFVESRGPGPHHLAFEVFEMDAALAAAEQWGARLVNRSPAEGPIQDVFLHPSNPTAALLRLTRAPIVRPLAKRL